MTSTNSQQGATKDRWAVDATQLHRSDSLAIVQMLILYHQVTAGATVALGGEGNRTGTQEHAILSQTVAK